ncbi:MAG: circadian clock protein KaiC [Methanotrichaceae archaeon]
MTERDLITDDISSCANLLEKSPTGIKGLDEITDGGLPKGRPTLICGSAGSGKTLLSMQFLSEGASKYNEPGVFVAFEETADELTKNFNSLGFDLGKLQEQNKILVDYIYIDSNEIEETGEYDLEGLFIRLGSAIDAIGAKRIVIDTIEVLFSGFSNEAILRSELRRLFRWLKIKGVTAIITGEQGEKTLTRYGLEEYVADCVILLDNRMENQIATRRMRIIKYRGSSHGMNEYPFMIEKDGISVLPITSLGLEHVATTERISSGIERLDTMLSGKGFFRGSSILLTGTAGTGKSSFASHFVDAACSRGERCIYFAFEESPSQICRNMSSIGINLTQWIDAGLLHIFSGRPMAHGLEMHLIEMRKLIDEIRPDAVVVDPVSNFVNAGTSNDVKFMLTRLVDYIKTMGITPFCTSLIEDEDETGSKAEGISSLMDTWLWLRMFDNGNERNRGITVIKSRGMEHSNQTREYKITDCGVKILDVYVGPQGGLLMGTERIAQEAKERAEVVLNGEETEHKRRVLENKLKSLKAQMDMLHLECETDEEELSKLLSEDELRSKARAKGRKEMARLRGADSS